MIKPSFAIEIGEGASPALDALVPLTLCADSACFHTKMELRLPLGIYNESLARVCDKLSRLSDRLERLFHSQLELNPQDEPDDLLTEVVDYMELTLYAAAEHVDDIESIASGFFRSSALRDQTASYKELIKQLKKHKRFVSTVANAIKHQQSRLRLFTMEYEQTDRRGCFHGYFIEAVENGVLCPSSKFHKNQDVFSVTTLVWEIVVFLLMCSRDLSRFLDQASLQHEGPVKADTKLFQKAVVAAARLPMYTFGEDHPFTQVTLNVHLIAHDTVRLDSGLYGSIGHKWDGQAMATFGRCVSRFSGDGKTRDFRFASPKTVALQHWR